MKITMIGAGYVGLVSGVCFSDFGHDVICVDKAQAKIEMLQAGQVPIYEPGLEALMAKNVAAGRLSFTTDLAAAVDTALGPHRERGEAGLRADLVGDELVDGHVAIGTVLRLVV